MSEYTLIRSKRKTVAVQVTENGEVVVRAPEHYSERKIRKFLSEHEEWIENAVQKQLERKSGRLSLSDEDVKKLKKLAKEVLTERVEYFSRIMGTQAQNVTITSAQKRFGSCSGKNNICFSYILMLYPPQAIDYVVVHELAHTVHHDHSRNFYSLVEKVLPDYKKREKLLKGEQRMPETIR